MKYFTREYIEKSLKTIEPDTFTINDKAQKIDELLYQQICKETYDHYCTVWNRNLSESEFKELLNHKINYYRELLPETIICKIADIRVCAMGIVSSDIYKDICEYNNQALQYCETMRLDYKKEYMETVKYLSCNCKNALDCNLEDARILTYEQSNDQLRIYFSLDSYTKDNDYDLMYLFTDGQFKEVIGTLMQDSIRTYEIYATEDSMEFHILCMNSQCIIKGKDLNYHYSDSYKYREGLT